eukprot:31494-Pelagococcus_subviridis.AAC.32
MRVASDDPSLPELPARVSSPRVHRAVHPERGAMRFPSGHLRDPRVPQRAHGARRDGGRVVAVTEDAARADSETIHFAAAGQRERVRVAARHAREPDVSDAEHVPRDPREEAP